MKQNVGDIEVIFDDSMKAAMKKIFSYKGKAKKPPEVVIETGTYLGTGTTKEIADILVSLKKDIPFYTIEAKKWIYDQAKKNLEKYKFIQPLYGLSLELEECLEFISNDEMIKNHQDYPDLYIDCTKDPVYMYRTEIWSCFADNPNPPIAGLFYDIIPLNRDKNPLIVLDSCGGIGLLEFNKIVELMETYHYYLFIDDIGHIKHNRTFNYIKDNSDNWKVLSTNGRCALAEFMG